MEATLNDSSRMMETLIDATNIGMRLSQCFKRKTQSLGQIYRLECIHIGGWWKWKKFYLIKNNTKSQQSNIWPSRELIKYLSEKLLVADKQHSKVFYMKRKPLAFSSQVFEWILINPLQHFYIEHRQNSFAKGKKKKRFFVAKSFNNLRLKSNCSR